MSIIKNTMARITNRSPRSSADLSSSSSTSLSSNSSAASSSSSPPVKEADKYRLLVTAGPSYDTSEHQTVPVNGTKPIYVENEFLRANIRVRIRGYRGLPTSAPSHSPYFDDPAHTKDQYSISFSFVPKQDLPCKDTAWGNDFDHPVRDRLPPGFNTAFWIVKEFIDPGLECDAYADEPYLYGPTLSSWFAFRVGEKMEDGSDLPDTDGPEDILREGADGSGAQVREQYNLPVNSEKRRKHFFNKSHQDEFVFEKGRLYQADFYNPYLDFGNFALKLPGCSIKVIKYIDEKSHCLRYVFKNRATGDIYFNVNLNLLWGDELKKAMKVEDAKLPLVVGANKEISIHDSDGEEEDRHDTLEVPTSCGAELRKSDERVSPTMSKPV